MQNPFEMFNHFITSHVEMTEAELTDFNQKCEIVEFPKGEIFIKLGESQDSLFFIIKGIVRNYIDTIAGDSKIYNFRIERMQVTGYALYNYKDSLKALVNSQCIEECKMIKVPLQTIKYVTEHFKNGERLGRHMAESHVIELMNYIIKRDTKSIIERYDTLEQDYPNIHQRIPQHMIASYLNITPVHLSNLKKGRRDSIDKK
jgi:CRP-like cAMP-binding protein